MAKAEPMRHADRSLEETLVDRLPYKAAVGWRPCHGSHRVENISAACTATSRPHGWLPCLYSGLAAVRQTWNLLGRPSM